MADPKIKYDIEAAVKGEADAEQLAKTLRGVGDVLEGDLQEGAIAAAQALEALASKQRAIDTFSALKRETADLESALTKATAQGLQLHFQLSWLNDKRDLIEAIGWQLFEIFNENMIWKIELQPLEP